MNTAVASAILAALLATPVMASDRLQVPGAASAHYMLKPYAERIRVASGVDLDVTPVGTGQAMLDLIQGRAGVAVVTVPLVEAVASARILEWSTQHRLLMVAARFNYHAVPAVDPNGRPLAFVTIGEPSPELARVIRYLDERNASRTALNP
jgi:hypothetical protein